MGQGELTTDRMHYQGDFVNNQMHGNGRIIFLRDGIEYEGSFVKDNIKGVGKFKWKNGDVYIGQVKFGKMHGNGIYKFKNGKEIKAYLIWEKE